MHSSKSNTLQCSLRVIDENNSASSGKLVVEATTDESQRSATKARGWLDKIKLRFGHRRSCSADKRSRKSSIARSHCHRLMKLHLHDCGDSGQDTCRVVSGSDFDDHTDSQLEMFQTLMSNSGLGAQSGTTAAAAAPKNRTSLQVWSGFDPDFLPTAYPLMRSNLRADQQAKWGVMNLAASAALLEEPLKAYDSVRNKRPRFRLGPRCMDDDGQGGPNDRSSMWSAQSTSSRSVLDAVAPKFVYISQDGKLVEREVRRWPYQKQIQVEMRYKMCEPYASNYGKLSVKQATALQMRPILPSKRRIYQRPIYMLPRSIVNENKRRLLARHALKTVREPGPGFGFRLPMKIRLLENEQSKRYLEYQKMNLIRETQYRIDYEEKAKQKKQQQEVATSNGTIDSSDA